MTMVIERTYKYYTVWPRVGGMSPFRGKVRNQADEQLAARWLALKLKREIRHLGAELLLWVRINRFATGILISISNKKTPLIGGALRSVENTTGIWRRQSNLKRTLQISILWKLDNPLNSHSYRKWKAAASRREGTADRNCVKRQKWRRVYHYLKLYKGR